MLAVRFPETTVGVSRVAGILDTWLLVSAFSKQQGVLGAHTTLMALAELRSLIIPGPVLVEAWGWIVGKHKELDAGLAMLEWVFDPSTPVAVLPDDFIAHPDIHRGCHSHEVDLVDAYVIHCYHSLVKQMDGDCSLVLISGDMRDLTAYVKRDGRSISVFDPRYETEAVLRAG